MITSNVSSMREVTGKAAILVDPVKVEVLARSIDEVALSDSTHDRLCQASLVRAKGFTWERTARQTLETLLQ